MSQKLIILRGASASGKSTIGEKLRDFDKKIVWFKTDNVKSFFSDAEERALDETMNTCLAILDYLLNQGYSVIYEGIFKNPDYFQKAIDLGKRKQVPTVIYELTCSLETLKKRNGIKPKPLRDIVIEGLFNKVKDNPIEGAIELNTEEKSIEECVEIIRNNFT